LEVVMIYEVQAGRIAKSWSVLAAKTLSARA
jgi:predicted ester cyclase